jgi:hypothetical protein
MALAPGDIPVTREMVHSWVTEWDESDKQLTLEDWIRGKIDDLELEEKMVDTTGHDYLGAETHIVDMILADLPSYLPPPDDASGS